MYTQPIVCPVCLRLVKGYRPELMPPNGRKKIEEAHKRGKNVGYITPYHHHFPKGSGKGCHASLGRYLMEYKPITQESRRGLYMNGDRGRFIYESPALWAAKQLGNRFVVNSNRED